MNQKRIDMYDYCECLQEALGDENEPPIAEGFQYCENHPDTVIPCRVCMYAEKD